MQVKAVFFGEPRMLLFLEHVVLFQVLHVPLFFSKFVPRNDPSADKTPWKTISIFYVLFSDDWSRLLPGFISVHPAAVLLGPS